jgi:divalent metal cation (Fe/Co/Zn/Cd) transporter
MSFALALAWENKRLLLGESVPNGLEADIRSTIRDHPGVSHVDAIRTVFFGPERALVTAEVSFDADLDTAALDEDISQIEANLRALDDRLRMIYIEPEL